MKLVLLESLHLEIEIYAKISGINHLDACRILLAKKGQCWNLPFCPAMKQLKQNLDDLITL